MAEVRRYAHGSRVPGWDRAVDLTKDPASIPDPATTPVPDELRAEIEAAMAKYPDRRSAAIPALAAAQHLHGWCSPEAIEQVACVMRLTPARGSATGLSARRSASAWGRPARTSSSSAGTSAGVSGPT